MGAYAASLRTQGRVPRRRTARWRPPVAVAAVVTGLAGGQALALGASTLGIRRSAFWPALGRVVLN